tara:strand:+ start:9909 stop:10490 length:582 start_codon:yes stop_codon:yes gene_type:complete
MDATDAQNRIRNIIDSETTAYFSNTELNEFMKMATDEFVQQYYMAFETTQDSRDKLQDLVISQEIDLIDTTPYTLSTLTATYSRFLSAYVKTSPSVNVKVIQIEDLSSYLNDPFNKADASNPVIYFKGGSINTIGFTSTTKVVVTYLKHTTTFTDLSDVTHEEVCQIAARKVLATLGDPRYQAIQTEISERRV